MSTNKGFTQNPPLDTKAKTNEALEAKRQSGKKNALK